MPVQGNIDFFGEFESEHNLGQKLYLNTSFKAALERFGYVKDMMGNRRGLFINADIVRQLADLPDGHPFKQFLAENGWGSVLHRGGDTTVGGFQEGKNQFQERLMRDWDRRSKLPPTDPDHITERAYKYAVDDLHRFGDDLATGKIKANGVPVGVVGTDPGVFQQAYLDREGAFDPGEINDSESAKARIVEGKYGAYEISENGRSSTGYSNALDQTNYGESSSDQTRARFRHVENLARAAVNSGIITPEQYNSIIDKLGKARTAGANIRNASIQLYRDASSKLGAHISKLSQHTVRALAEGRAVAVARANATVTELEDGVSRERVLVEVEQANKGSLRGSLADYGVETARAMHQSAIQLGNKATRVAGQIAGSPLNSPRAAVAGLGIGYVDHVYDSFLKGWNTDDWSDYWIDTVQFGAVATIAFGGIAVVTGLVAGTAAAPFVAAGLVIVGVVGTGIALGSLAGKVINDILGIEEVPQDPGAVAQALQDNLLFVSKVGERILYDWYTGQIGKSRLPGLEITYLADDQIEGHPDQVRGTVKPELFYADNGAMVYGGAGGDEIYHAGYGSAVGGSGQDAVVGVNAKVLKEGEYLYPWMNEARAQRIVDNEHIRAENIERAELELPLLLVLPELPESPKAPSDLTLELDGGSENDIVFALGGKNATTIGGLGRDWIWNRSENGIIWGDIANSYDLGRYREAQVDGETVRIEDNAANSDNIWYWADTTLMDPGHSDVMKYFGIPMTGGDANGGLAGYAIFNGLFGAAIGMGNLNRYFSGQASDWTGEVYIDHIQPWIMYVFKRGEDGNLDMYVTNAFEQIFDGLNAALNLGQQDTVKQIHKGYMKIENVDVVGSRLGVLQDAAANQVLSNGKKGGSLSMVFRALNPLQALLPVINLIPGLIGQALYYSVFADALVGTIAAMGRFTKSLGWAIEADPLVIDLDGDGIETTTVDGSKAYFDVDGDMFRERTGWLKGDDGFLVLDANNNGRVDGIGELFGDRFQGGFAELAAYDDNGDGKISVADLVWSELKIWQDRDRDGETDAGELRSLSALGIVEFNLASTALNATTPQGAQLLSRSEVRFASGRVTSMFEAIFTSNEVDTKYAGEAGRAPWQLVAGQSANTLDAKGFGTITDLAVATANDNEFSIPMTRIAA